MPLIKEKNVETKLLSLGPPNASGKPRGSKGCLLKQGWNLKASRSALSRVMLTSFLWVGGNWKPHLRSLGALGRLSYWQPLICRALFWNVLIISLLCSWCPLHKSAFVVTFSRHESGAASFLALCSLDLGCLASTPGLTWCSYLQRFIPNYVNTSFLEKMQRVTQEEKAAMK